MASTVVLDQQVRTGTSNTASLAVPAGATQVTLDTTMSSVDALDTAKRAIVGVRLSYDGLTYVAAPSLTYEWQGGPDRFGHARGPSIGGTMPFDAGGNPPVRAMAFLDTEGFSLNTGITLDFS